jgi:hypothetical protein
VGETFIESASPSRHLSGAESPPDICAARNLLQTFVQSVGTTIWLSTMPSIFVLATATSGLTVGQWCLPWATAALRGEGNEAEGSPCRSPVLFQDRQLPAMKTVFLAI